MKRVLQLVAKTPLVQANLENIAMAIRATMTAFDVEIVNMVDTRKPVGFSTTINPVSEDVEGPTVLKPAPHCQCESGKHFGGHPDVSHAYAKEFPEEDLKNVKTTWGTFNLCKDCRIDCHKEGM